MYQKLALGLVCAALVAQLATPAAAQRRGAANQWERLGCVDVRRRGDTEVIEVGRREGAFTALRFHAVRNDVQIAGARVIYGNGESDVLRVQYNLSEGRRSAVADLEGRQRFIRRIEVNLRKERGSGRGPARLCVEGREFRRPAPRVVVRPVWEELGCVDTGLRKDYDVVSVGKRDGRYKAIRVRSVGGKIDIERVRVIYGNGRPDDLRFSASLDRGVVSQSFDLAGGDRFIREVQLVSKRDTKDAVRGIVRGLISGRGSGKARVCVEGLQDERFTRRGRR